MSTILGIIWSSNLLSGVFGLLEQVLEAAVLSCCLEAAVTEDMVRDTRGLGSLGVFLLTLRIWVW